ncbi:MAG: hypothetical protein A2Y74_01135 [Actinobacteria bacterium RBG_13_63_9]|nr:MAG: hypothetical protein A2Y74_01135 [Actinobacteria bacterium RBG_13_63_9]
MADPQVLARMYHATMSRMVRDGRAPHYTELAAELSLSLDEAREALRQLGDGRVPGFFLYPNVDLIASPAPFSNIPTQYLISVEGEQKWYGQ